jgi:UPF0755 protein
MAFYAGSLVKERPKKKSSAFGIVLFLLVLLIGGGFYLVTASPYKDKINYYRCYVQKDIATKQFGNTQLHAITIVAGDTPLDIGTKLEEKGIVDNAADFLCYVHKIDAGNKIQAGYYEIQTPVSIEQLVPLLQSARVPTVRVTIPEGLRLDEIADRIDTAMGKENTIKKFDKAEFLALTTDKEFIDYLAVTKGKKSLEGVLYPDTYDIEKNADATKILTLLLDTFTRKVVDNSTLMVSKSLTPYNIMVLASIIEKEAGKSYEEKQMVSGILQKRMSSGWLLEVDATFLYEKKDWKAPITVQDKANNTPYNTYIRSGLPPTPICNPGVDSILAALSPKSSSYWFYLHGNDGIIRYGKTYDEHVQNISLYLR